MSLAVKKRRVRKKAHSQRSSLNDEPRLDLIAKAFERERENQRLRAPERDSVWNHVFRCVCCGKVLDERERREPRSEVCVRCVREAGFFN